MSKQPPTPSEKVYACFFPSNTTEDQVRSMFEKFGTIVLLQFHQRKNGFTYAHITYDNIQSAHDSIVVMNKMKLHDKIISVTFADENCVPKWKKIQESNEQSNKEIEPSSTEESIYSIGRVASKKTIKREKQRQRKRLRTLIETKPNTLQYLDKIQEALRDVLKLKEELMALKKEEKNKNKKIAKPPQPKEPKEPEDKKESKISISDLSIFKSWLKKTNNERKIDEGAETEWEDVIEVVEVQEKQVQ